MSNKQEYVYANIIDREDNQIFVKKSDGYWYSNGSNKISNTYGITQLDSNWSYDACIRNGKTVETSNRSTWTVISFFNDKTPVWVTGGTNVGSFGCITEDNKLYVWGRNSHGELGLGHTNSVSSPTLVTVPNNEKPFMYMMGDNQSVLVTTVGNMYIAGYDTYVTVNGRSNITSFRKVPGVSNVTHFTVVDGNTPDVHIYYTTVDGFAYVIGGKSHCTPTKLNISNAKYCFGRNSDSGYAMITCEDGSSYFCNGTSISKTNVSGSVCCCTVNNYNNTYVSDINGKIYTGTSGSLSVNGTYSSNAAKPEIKVDGLAVSFPSNLLGVYDKSPNGLKYNYRVRFVQTDQITETSNVVNYVTEWGTDTKYGNTFQDGCGSYEFKADDATNSVEILSTYAVNAIKKLEDKLNKYIGPFDKPSGRNNLSSNGYVSKGNGTAYFYNIEVLSGSVSPGLTTESATIQFQAKWGTEKNATKLTNIYKNTSIKDETLIDGVKRDAYSTDSEGKVTYTIIPNNYASRESIFKEILDKLENGLKLQLDSYIGNISALDDVRRSITSAGSQYYAKVTRTGTNTEAYATNAKMYLELSYSKGNESYNTIRKDNSGENMYKADLQITGANYLEREKLTNELAQSLLNLWEAYVRTLFDKITKAPESKTDNWPTTTGKNIWVQMDFSLGASSEGEQIINSAFKYSLNNATCDQLYKNGSITINSTNYLTKETEYTNHFNKILAEFKNESSFLNSTPPEEITVNYLALNGITYTCKFKWEYAGTRDWIKSVYRLVTTYGQASDQATTEFRRTTTVEITRENVSYAIRMALFQAEQERELAQLKAYLDTLVANVTIPTPVAREYVATNGQTYAYRVSCTVTPDSDAKSNVTIKSEWGKTTNYGNDFATSTFVLTAVNQTSFDSTVARLMNSHEIKMKGFLDQLIENVAFNGKSGQNLASNGAYYYYKTTVIGLGTTSKTPSEYIKEVGAIE